MADGFPKAVDKPGLEDPVQIIVSEAWAREFEMHLLRKNDLHLAGPVVFSDDDLPSYTIGIGRKTA